MNYAKIYYCDLVNGEGIRLSLFVSGCNHNCKGCFNSVAFNPKYGNEFTEDVSKKIIDYTYKYRKELKGLSLLGGDPTYASNIEPLCNFIDEYKNNFPEKDIWLWSGFTWEEILEDPERKRLVSKVDVLIDGKFDESQKDYTLYWKGSKNQRVIDVKESLKQNKVCIYKNYK